MVFSLTLTSACHAVSRSADCRRLLSRLGPTAQCPTISAIVCFPDSDRQSCADETRLWHVRYVRCLVYRPTYTESPPVSSQRCSSRSIAGLRRSDHVTDTLASFHWLRAPERINLNWRSLYTELCTALHLDTYLTFFAALLTCRLVVVYGRDFQPT